MYTYVDLCIHMYVCMYVCMYVHMYICAVELKTGPIFAFSSVKNWSTFCFCKSHPPCRKKRIVQKKEENKKNISSVKNWSNFVAQHTWTSF